MTHLALVRSARTRPALAPIRRLWSWLSACLAVVVMATLGVTPAHAATPTPTISGTITVPSGTPGGWYQSASVFVFDPQNPGQPIAAATVSSTGRYSVAVPAGRWTVAFLPQALSQPGTGPNLQDQFYGGVTDFQDATLVDVRTANASGIDAALKVGNIVNLSVTDMPAGSEVVYVITADGKVVAGMFSGSSSSARITFKGLPDGTYYLKLGKRDASVSGQLLFDGAGHGAIAVSGGQSVSVSSTAKPLASSIQGSLYAYGFSDYVDDGFEFLGQAYLHQVVDGVPVLLSSRRADNRADQLGSNRYAFPGMADGDYIVRFAGLPDYVPGATAAQYLDEGDVTERFYRGAESAADAQRIEITAQTHDPGSAGQTVTGVDGTIRPVGYDGTATGFVDADDVRGPIFTEFAQQIAWLKEQGIATGSVLADGSAAFAPKSSITREAMAAFLYRAAGSPDYTPPDTSPFVDVTDGSTAFVKEILWLADQGISTGWITASGREFRPKARITREAMAAFLYRYAQEPDVTAPAVSPFVDASPSTTAFYPEITWLADQGISTGWKTPAGAQFRPKSPITREAMAAFLKRYADLN